MGGEGAAQLGVGNTIDPGAPYRIVSIDAVRPDSKLVIALPTSVSALPQIGRRIPTDNSIRGDRYFLLGCGNYYMGGRFVKTNPAPMQRRPSIIWHDLQARPANCQSRIAS